MLERVLEDHPIPVQGRVDDQKRRGGIGALAIAAARPRAGRGRRTRAGARRARVVGDRPRAALVRGHELREVLPLHRAERYVAQRAPVRQRAGRHHGRLAELVPHLVERLLQRLRAIVLREQLDLLRRALLLQRPGGDAEQSQRLARPVLAPQGACDLEHAAMIVHRHRQRALTRDRAEPEVAELHGDRAAREAVPAQPPRHLVGESQDRPLEELGVAAVLGQRHLVPHGLGIHAFVIRHERRLVVAPRRLAQLRADHAERLLQHRRRGAPEVAHRVDAELVQPRRHLRAHAPQLLHAEGPVRAAESLLVQRRDAARLLQPRGHLRDELVRADADGRAQAVVARDAGLDVARDLRGVLQRAAAGAETEERLVHAERLHVGRDGEEELQQLERLLHVLARIALDVLGVRTEATSLRERHACAHPRWSRLVRRRRHHATAGRVAADDHGLAAQLRVQGLLDRREERVHVHEQDHAGGPVHARLSVQRETRGSNTSS